MDRYLYIKVIKILIIKKWQELMDFVTGVIMLGKVSV